MTNADKYLKDGVDVIDFTCKFANYLHNHQGELLSHNKKAPREQLYEFLASKVKPTLSEEEKVILRNLPKKYEFIGRNNHSILQLSKISKIKEDCYCDEEIDELFNHLFQFIQPRRRI